MNKVKAMSCECPVCYEDKEDNHKFRCGHHMCMKCSKKWFVKNTSCPMCRAHVRLSKRSRDYLREIRYQLQNNDRTNVKNLLSSVEEWRNSRKDEASIDFLNRVEQLVYRYVYI